MPSQRGKRYRRASAADNTQGDLFKMVEAAEQVPVPAEPSRQPASLDLTSRIRRWTNEAIEQSVFSRPQIAEIMSDLTGRAITKPMIDTWTGESRTNRMPAELVPAFCVAVGNAHLLQQMAAVMGALVMDTQQARLARMGQYALITVMAQEQMRALADNLPPLPMFGGRS
ncbi:hypothetical protein GE253_05195 [Niveispirillum sp. SYP-B3756]|uniref:hypothetical protein n=1 Tax=Niveispirillum sp. SYP-B3756 TaxID=2662178 RepID=UPI0012925C4B|nr:hypothetical protein [Niveispirillum sp. SYP-B3756]MQP64738.1 hypothetical protein [Niveispirillum sp. SYP-B3756]